MDYTPDVVNITKIKDGFFLGDEATASNLDVIIQFKITHMVNAAGSQIINAWESIGIKYLTLNWSEHSNQNLFDQKDEIANRIVNFIDDSTKTGEGLLVHSLRGQNRGCIVVLIYLIKKYRWTLAKSLEFLTNKKMDVEIPKYFLNQLSFFESRLSKIGHGPRSNSWLDNGNDGDPEELVIRNTYLNGLAQKEKSQSDNRMKGYNYNSRRITWADNNHMNKSLLCSINMGRELVYQKDIKPVLSHKKLKPTKSCLKVRSQSLEIKKSPSGILSSKLSESIVGGMGDKRESSKNLANVSGLGSEMNLGSRDKTKDMSGIGSKYIGTNSGTFGKYPDNTGMNPSSINHSTNPSSNNYLRSSSNELLKNYTNLGNLYTSLNMGDNMHNNINSSISMNSNAYNLSKSLNLDNNNSKTGSRGDRDYRETRDRDNSGMPNISHHNVGGGSLIGSVNNQGGNPSQGSRQNNFTMNNTSDKRSYSVGTDPNKSGGNSSQNVSNTNNQSNNQIIIASKYKNVVHNSYNNIFIQSPTGLDNIINSNNPSNHYESGKMDKNTQGIGVNSSNMYNNNISSSKINQMVNSINPQSQNYMSSNQQNQSQSKLTKSSDNQRLPPNNYFMGNSNGVSGGNNMNPTSMLDYKNLKVIDYTTPTSNVKPSSGGYGNMSNNQSTNYQYQGGYMSNNTKASSLNNYQPELNKKNVKGSNMNMGTGLLNRQSSQGTKGPVKIQNEYERKPSTPDNIYHSNYSNVKLGASAKMQHTPQSHSNYGTIKRSNSRSKTEGNPNDRPSTAPQKENDKHQGYGSSHGPMKRLPSPNLKSGNSNTLGSSAKNMNIPSGNLGNSINIARCRSPSPSTLNKSSTITLGSMKAHGGNKPKWK